LQPPKKRANVFPREGAPAINAQPAAAKRLFFRLQDQEHGQEKERQGQGRRKKRLLMDGIADELAAQGRHPKAFPYDEMNDHAIGRKRRVKTANKRAATDIRTVAEICAAFDYNPIEAVVTALQGDELGLGEKVRTAMGLAEYIHPKLARQEITGKDGLPIQVTLSGADARL
jgi:hypothetical protein